MGRFQYHYNLLHELQLGNSCRELSDEFTTIYSFTKLFLSKAGDVVWFRSAAGEVADEADGED